MKRKILAGLLALTMVIGMFPVVAFADESTDLVITLFNVGDFHGHMTSEQNDQDPGAARFVAFVDDRVAHYVSTTGYEPVVLLAGDNFFGQHVSNLFMGEPGLKVLNRINPRFSTVGNHEFSFGNRFLTESFGITDAAERAAFLVQHDVENTLFDILPAGNILNSAQPGVTFLAADLRYDDGTRPAWVQPYAILDDWYAEYGVRVGIIGLTGLHMYATVDAHNRQGLNFMLPGHADMTEDESFGWLEDMINDLRAQGVQAIIALTHSGHNAESFNIIDGLLSRGNAHFDGWFSSHSHSYLEDTRVYPEGAEGSDILRRTEVIAGGHHGRGMGQLQLHFNDGELVDITTYMYGAFNGNAIRAFDPDQEVLEWVFGRGATWTRVDATGEPDPQGLNLAIDASAAGNNREMWGWYQARLEWGEEHGPRGVFGRNQHTRNQYLVYLMHDYIMRVHPGDIEAAGANGLIVMNNQSAWRGQGLHRLQWRPEDSVRTTDFLDALTFENTLPIFEMRGRDVIELLNMPAGANPPGGAGGAERDPDTGLPNWGTMQGQTIAGAFLQNGVWFLAATLQPISEDGIYLFGASNHMFGGHVGTRQAGNPDAMLATAGGQNMPLPGNSFGNALGFEVINFVGGQLEYNENRYYSGPRFAMRDPETGIQITIQEAWRRQAEYRRENPDVAVWVEVQNTPSGTAEMNIWGFEARPDTPGNFSYWGAPAMLANNTGAHGEWSGIQANRDLVLRGAAVRVTASPVAGFLGWFERDNPDTPLSTDPVFIFTAQEDTFLFPMWGVIYDIVPTELDAPVEATVIIDVPFNHMEVSGQSFVGLRVVAEALGASVAWVDETRSVIVFDTEGYMLIQFSVDEVTEIPVVLESNRVFLPTAFVSDLFGVEMAFDLIGLIITQA